jgi:hypothetical protein
LVGWPIGCPGTWLGNSAEHHWGFGAVLASMVAIVGGIPFLVGFAIGVVEKRSSTGGGVRNVYVPGSSPNRHPWQRSQWYAHENLMEQERQTAALNQRRD